MSLDSAANGEILGEFNKQKQASSEFTIVLAVIEFSTHGRKQSTSEGDLSGFDNGSITKDTCA